MDKYVGVAADGGRKVSVDWRGKAVVKDLGAGDGAAAEVNCLLHAAGHKDTQQLVEVRAIGSVRGGGAMRVMG